MYGVYMCIYVCMCVRIYICVRMYIHQYVCIYAVLLPGKFCSIKITLLTQAEIKSMLQSLKPRNSSGYDEITHKILKSCARLIIQPLH